MLSTAPVSDLPPHSTPHRPARLYLVLPAFNEGDTLLTLLEEVQRALAGRNMQVLVVDDGSTDGSIERVERAALPQVDVIRHPVNRGLGEACKTGFLAALARAQAHDLVAVMDSDCTHSPYLLERMMQYAREGNDVVIASRYRYGSQVVGLEWFREFLSHAASWTFRVLLPIPNVRDYTCGFRVYRVSILQRAFEHYQDRFITEAGFACMADMLVKLARLGAICVEVPMILRYDRKESTSKIKIARTIQRSLGLIGLHWWRRLQ